MKISQIRRELVKNGWYFLRQGKHEIWTNGNESVAIPRHKEINEFTAKNILRQVHMFKRDRGKK